MFFQPFSRRLTLDKLPLRKKAVILAIDGDNPLRRRLLDMGLTPGTTVTMLRTAPLGDPLALSLRGYKLALRRADAACISILF
ncbi:MAG: ferrous iron transport protein A [Ruminococcaceae bacterium]|nr:ferrous iron transport protein A [Oscillospiraceae bacterium]